MVCWKNGHPLDLEYLSTRDVLFSCLVIIYVLFERSLIAFSNTKHKCELLFCLFLVAHRNHKNELISVINIASVWTVQKCI